VILACQGDQIIMITSQYIMVLALGSITITWIISWATGHCGAAINRIFSSLCVQALAAILLSFSSDNILLSILFTAIILGAILWMVRGSAPAREI
jgi:hypothetical protein